MGKSGISGKPSSRVYAVKDLRKIVREEAGEETRMPEGAKRPVHRADCVDGPRPCPWVGCKHHLAFSVRPSGSLEEHFPGMDIEDLEETCLLDVAEKGPQTLVRTAELMNVTRSRVQQLEEIAVAAFRARSEKTGLGDAEEDDRPRRRLPIVRGR